MWECESNMNGGRLVILFKKTSPHQRELKMLEDKIWLETVCLLLI